MSDQLTQLLAELLLPVPHSPARATQIVVETLDRNPHDARVTQLCVEYLSIARLPGSCVAGPPEAAVDPGGGCASESLVKRGGIDG